MAQDWFSDITTPAPQQAPQAPQQRTPNRIYGPVSQPDPVEQERLDLARNADARAQASEQRQRQQFEMDTQKAIVDLQEKVKPQESERTAGFLATNLAGAFNELERVTRGSPQAASPNVGAKVAGSLFGPVAENYLNDPARQQVEAAQLTILDNALTLGTGAAYTKEQLEGYRQSYFPQLGDAPSTVDFKRVQLRRLLEAARIKAGDAAPMIDQVLAKLNETGNAGLSPEEFDAQLGRMIRQGASKEDILKFYADNSYAVGNPEILDEVVSQRRGQVVREGDDLGQSFMRGVGGVVQGVGDVLGIVGNPLNAGINATGIPQAIGVGELSTDIGASLRSALGLPFPENDEQRAYDAINRGGAAALLTAGAAGAAGGAAGFGGGGGGGGGASIARNALARIGAAPGIDTAAGAAAGGAAEMTRQSGGGTAAQIAAGLAAGAGGAGIASMARNALAPQRVNPMLQAANRQGVRPLAADVGGTVTQKLTAGAAQGPFSGGPVGSQARRSVEQLQGAARRTTNATGNVLPEDEAGSAVRRAGELFSRQSSERGGRLYRRAEEMSKGVRIKARSSLTEIDVQLAQLNEAPNVNGPLIRELEKFRTDLAQNNGISPAGLKAIRSVALKASYNEDLRSTPAKKVLGDLANAIAQDVETGLAAAGRKEAAQAFRKADQYWRQRVEQIDDVLEPIIGGNKSGEDVLRAFEGMTRGRNGGVERLSKMLRLLPEQEANDVQATIIDRMGRAKPGQQNAEGTAFSASSFLTNWNQMTPKAKAALFPSPETRNNLNDIAMLADGMRQTQRFANTSNTAGGLVTQMMLSGGIGAIGGFKGLAAATMLQYASGKVLASRALTNWVARAPANPSPRYVDRLAAIAANEPTIANEVRQMQQRISEAMSNMPQRAAASGPNANQDERQRREEIPQR